jgi:hypothetical protein
MNTTHPDDSEIIHTDGGTTITGQDAMLYFKAAQLKGFIKLYMNTGMIPTRGVGIKSMLAQAAAITKTKKPYKTSKPEQQRALDELTTWCHTMKAALPITDKRTQQP